MPKGAKKINDDLYIGTNFRTIDRFMICQSEAIKALSLAPPGRGRNVLASLLNHAWDQALPVISGTVRSHAVNVLAARWRLV